MNIEEFIDNYDNVLQYLKNIENNKPSKVKINCTDVYGFDINNNMETILNINDFYIIEHKDNLGIEIVIHSINNIIVRKYISIPALFKASGKNDELIIYLITGVILNLTFYDLQNIEAVIE